MFRSFDGVTDVAPSKFDCELITLMEIVPGHVDISSTSVSFTATKRQCVDNGSSWDFKIALSQLRELHLRNFNHRRSALEFFLVDQTNYFINFTKEVRFLCLFMIFRAALIKTGNTLPLSSHHYGVILQENAEVGSSRGLIILKQYLLFF